MEDQPPVGPGIDGLLEAVVQAGGTDLLLTVGMPPQMRVHGKLCSVPRAKPLTAQQPDIYLAEILTEEQAASLDMRQEHDFSFTWRDQARVRGNAFSQRGFTAIALRVIPMEIPTMSELGLPGILRSLARQHQGLILVTGPTGSGKSTTLAAIVDQINTERACHILTIEDPIEYVHRHKTATVNQREVGTDTASFAGALRASLRNDPDVLLVGEMRDLESIRFTLSLAETGHLVLASLHTNDSAQTLARIVDVFPAEQQAQVRTQLAAALTAVVYQRLLPRSDGGGLIAAFEVMVANAAIRNLIKEGKTHQLRNALVSGRREGMITIEQSLTALVKAGVVSYEDAVVRSLYPREIEQTAPVLSVARS